MWRLGLHQPQDRSVQVCRSQCRLPAIHSHTHTHIHDPTGAGTHSGTERRPTCSSKPLNSNCSFTYGSTTGTPNTLLHPCNRDTSTLAVAETVRRGSLGASGGGATAGVGCGGSGPVSTYHHRHTYRHTHRDTAQWEAASPRVATSHHKGIKLTRRVRG